MSRGSLRATPPSQISSALRLLKDRITRRSITHRVMRSRPGTDSAGRMGRIYLQVRDAASTVLRDRVLEEDIRAVRVVEG
jgi:hypothetical protein